MLKDPKSLGSLAIGTHPASSYRWAECTSLLCNDSHCILRKESVLVSEVPLLLGTLGTCGTIDRALDSRSEGLGFDSQC